MGSASLLCYVVNGRCDIQGHKPPKITNMHTCDLFSDLMVYYKSCVGFNASQILFESRMSNPLQPARLKNKLV